MSVNTTASRVGAMCSCGIVGYHEPTERCKDLCVKCGWGEVAMKYNFPQHISVKQCLRVTCKRCGWIWERQCLDSATPKGGDGE